MLTLLLCLLLATAAWGGAGQAAGPACSETADQVAVHVEGDCDEVPADADANYPHCHTGCHGHHVAAPMPVRASARNCAIAHAYAPAAQRSLVGRGVDQTLRPPQA